MADTRKPNAVDVPDQTGRTATVAERAMLAVARHRPAERVLHTRDINAA